MRPKLSSVTCSWKTRTTPRCPTLTVSTFFLPAPCRLYAQARNLADLSLVHKQIAAAVSGFFVYPCFGSKVSDAPVFIVYLDAERHLLVLLCECESNLVTQRETRTLECLGHCILNLLLCLFLVTRLSMYGRYICIERNDYLRRNTRTEGKLNT